MSALVNLCGMQKDDVYGVAIFKSRNREDGRGSKFGNIE